MSSVTLSSATWRRRSAASTPFIVVHALIGSVVLGVGGAGPALAAPPQTLTFVDSGLSCSGLTTSGDPVSVAAYASADFGSGAYVRVGTDENQPLEAFGSGQWEGDRLGFDLTVYDGPEGEPIGSGTFTASTTDTSSTASSSHGGSGNQRVRIHTVETTLGRVRTYCPSSGRCSNPAGTSSWRRGQEAARTPRPPRDGPGRARGRRS